jgi:hypothetical protein
MSYVFSTATGKMTWLFSRCPFFVAAGLVCLLCPLVLGDEPGSVSPDGASGGVVLKWTAPGDDGYVGRATGYDVRYHPISFGPIDTETEWQAAAKAHNLPIPSPSGNKDSVMILGLVPGMAYYFVLRSYDEAYNISELSNSPLLMASLMDCCQGRVGDVNGRDGDEPTLSDIMILVDHLFLAQGPLWCVAEADVDQSGGTNPQQGLDSDIGLGDIMILVDHIFLSGRLLPDCLQ